MEPSGRSSALTNCSVQETMPVFRTGCSPVASTKHLKSTRERPITCMRLPLLSCFALRKKNQTKTKTKPQTDRNVILKPFFSAVCPQNVRVFRKAATQLQSSSNSANHTWQFFSSIYIQKYFTEGKGTQKKPTNPKAMEANQTNSSLEKLTEARSVWVNQLCVMAFVG